MTLTVSNATAILKTIYPNGVPLDMVYQDFPLFAMLPKVENFYGENLKLPIKYANNSGRSATFSTAVSSSSYAKTVAFTLTRDQDYAYATISNEVLEASRNNAGAFVEALKLEMDSAILALSASIGSALYGTGSGKIGRIDASTNVATAVLVLTDSNDTVNFDVGDVLQVSTANGGGATKAGTLTVSAVNRQSGEITMTQNLNAGIGTIATGDYVFIAGDYDEKIKGLQAWIPDSAPGATAFFGVDRTVDSRLGGVREDYSSIPIEEALIDGAKLINSYGGAPKHTFMNYENLGNLTKALGSKVQYVDVSVAGIGFRGIQVNTGRGIMNVFGDQNCPSDRMFMLQLDTWGLYSLGKVPRIFNGDGQAILRVSDADSLEFRALYYAQLGCKAPFFNGNFKIA